MQFFPRATQNEILLKQSSLPTVVLFNILCVGLILHCDYLMFCDGAIVEQWALLHFMVQILVAAILKHKFILSLGDLEFGINTHLVPSFLANNLRSFFKFYPGLNEHTQTSSQFINTQFSCINFTNRIRPKRTGSNSILIKH